MSEEVRGIFSLLPHEIIFDQILPYFEYKWILQTVRLVCKYWNENYKLIPTFYFPIRYSGNLDKLKLMLNQHSDELHKITFLSVEASSNNEQVLKMEREFVSKLTNLQEFKLLVYCNDVVSKELAKLTTLKKVHLPYGFGDEIMKTRSKIKSFSSISPFQFQMMFDDIDWPLEEFLFKGGSMTPESFMSVLKNKTFNLKVIEVSLMELSEEHLQLLGNMESLTSLKCNLKSVVYGDKMKHITKLEHLKELKCSSFKCGDAVIEYISKLTKLESLNLDCNEIYGSGFKDFARLTLITNLELCKNCIDDEGANYLSSLISLKYLFLNNNKISSDGLKNYWKLSNLLELDLDNNQIGSEGAKYLSKLPSIKYLYLTKNKIEHGFEYFSECKSLIQLEVESNNISDLSVVNYCEQLPNIQTLSLSSNPIGNGGLMEIAHLGNLNDLSVADCEITDKGVEQFLKILSTRSDFALSKLLISDKWFIGISKKHLIKFTGLVSFGNYIRITRKSNIKPHIRKNLE